MPSIGVVRVTASSVAASRNPNSVPQAAKYARAADSGVAATLRRGLRMGRPGSVPMNRSTAGSRMDGGARFAERQAIGHRLWKHRNRSCGLRRRLSEAGDFCGGAHQGRDREEHSCSANKSSHWRNASVSWVVSVFASASNGVPPTLRSSKSAVRAAVRA